jgi:hypothetical protein
VGNDDPQPVVNLGQSGDLGEIAGGNIYHGLPADLVVQMLAREIDKDSTYRQLDGAAREIRQRETDAAMDRLYRELRLIRWILAAAAILAIMILAAAVFR